MRETQFRICQLANCNRWRVELLRHPRRIFFWVKPRWMVAYRWTLFLDQVPAEYETLADAAAAMARFQATAREADARRANRWELI